MCMDIIRAVIHLCNIVRLIFERHKYTIVPYAFCSHTPSAFDFILKIPCARKK